MNLIVLAAVIAACGAAKLDRTYLPPSSADSAGGSPGFLQAPLTRSSEQASLSDPSGSYTNSFDGVVVDAESPGTRSSSDAVQTGLGGSRPSYGSSNSKVGEAAFRESVAGFRAPSVGAEFSQSEQSYTSNGQNNGANGFTLNGEVDTHSAQGFLSNGPQINHQIGSHAGQFINSPNFQGFEENKSERPQATKDRNSNILTLSNDVNTNSYSYGFETDNGIAVGENGVAVNGIQAEGGYSYQGDDGQVYKVTYTADEGGYRPQGAHLPTPPPIPEEILKSLEQNAKEEAAGVIDDGSYDAQKYNGDGDYTHDNSGSIQHNGAQFGKRPESNTPIGTFNQNNQAYPKPGALFGTGHNAQNNQAQLTQVNENTGSQFGVASNEKNGQLNRKPSSGQFGIAGSQPAFNGQSAPVSNRPGSALFESGSLHTHSSFEQSSHGNKFSPNPASNENVYSDSQNSHSSHTLSGHEGSGSLQAFGQNTENQFSSSFDQTSGASGNQAQFGSQFGQQTSVSAQFDSRLPESSLQLNQQGFAQIDSKPSKPSLSQSVYNSLSAQPQFGSSFKPQGSEAFSGASLNKEQDSQDFGKPSPHTFSGQNFNSPLAGNLNKPSFGQIYKGSSSENGINQFSQTSSHVGTMNDSGNNFSFNSNSQTPGFTANLGTPGLNLNGQKGGKKDQTPHFIAYNEQKQSFASASASTSFGQPTIQSQSAKPFNTQSQSKPNQNTQQQITQFTQQTNQFSSQAPTQFHTNSFGQSALGFGSKPTMLPDTELTTPLEPNEISASQGSHISSQTTSSFGPASNQASSQFGLKANSAFGQLTSQSLPSSFPTPSTHSNSHFETTATQNGFQSSVENGAEKLNSKPQFFENNFNQKPQNQGFESSYYDNKPSMVSSSAFSQGSKFPSSPSYQSTGVSSQSKLFSQQNLQSTTKYPGSPSFAQVRPTSPTQFAQTQGYSGITQAAISPFSSVSPTSSNQYSMIQNGQFGTQSSFNHQSSLGIQAQSPTTKPSYSQQSFSDRAQVTGNQGNTKFPLPSSSGRFPIRPISQIDENPESQTTIQFDHPEGTSESSDNSSQQQTQQHQGTVYEYSKPSEVLPVPSQIDSSSSQSIQTGIASDSKPSLSQSQKNELSTQQSTKPVSSFGSQNQAFGSAFSAYQIPNPQAGQGSQASEQTDIQFGSQQAQPFNAPSSTNIQFGQSAISKVQSAKPFGTTSTSNFDSLALNSPSQGIQSSFQTKPQLGEQGSQFSQNFGNSRPSRPETGSGSQSIQNSQFSQDKGYFYPANPKPQFGEVSDNQFNHNSQSVRPQPGEINQFKQNTQSGYPQSTSFFNGPSSKFNSGTVPQFAQSQGNQITQAAIGQKVPNPPIQPLSQLQFGQTSASSQAVASGQASASASASTSPQQYDSFGSQNKNQFSQTTDGQNSGQSQLFGKNNQGSNKEPSSKPFGSIPQGSKPLFDSACCQGSKDSTPAQSVDRLSQASFQGTQSFTTQGFAGQGEEFGGPRQPPSFDDQTGYHY